MALRKYGVLKGTVVGHLRDADDDHYQILVRAAGEFHRIAVNVRSSAPNAPSTLLFLASVELPEAFRGALDTLGEGYAKLASKPGGLALDYLRDHWFAPADLRKVPPDEPGADNDLKDKLEEAAVGAMERSGSFVYAFGEKWGPERKKDNYFNFVPGNGIHDIHMNQGNGEPFKRDNGVHQDGALVFQYPDGAWVAFFFAFQSQSFATDDSGAPL